MLSTPWSDGAPGITQKLVEPNCSFTHKWVATQYGSFFYHSHSENLINDGLYGSIVIHPSPDRPTPYYKIPEASIQAIQQAEKERIPLVISDWRQMESEREWAISQESNLEHLCFDSMLVNGQGNVYCLTPEEQAPLIIPGQAEFLSIVPNSTLTSKSCVPAENFASLAPNATRKPNPSVIPPELYGDCKATAYNPDIRVIKGKSGKEKWAMFDIIGALALATVSVSIDEIPLWVVAIDGNFIEPEPAHALVLFNGQRYTVVAKFVKPKRYTFRVASVSDPQILFGSSIIDFQVDGPKSCTPPAASVPYIDRRGAPLNSSVIIYDGMIARPFGAHAMSQTVDATYKVTMGVADTINQWALNVTSRPDTENGTLPWLFNPLPGLMDGHTITVPSDKSWVDYIMSVPGPQPPHPIHVHGRHFYVIGSGIGVFKWNNVAEAVKEIPGSFNLENPQLRDTYISPRALTPNDTSWLAIRRPSDNEGAWLIHCHIQSHFQGGMSMVIQDGSDSYPKIPDEYLNWQC
jgi:FtsP/CotA-like multicopper oxidase with cupredoxin domain